jgi:signal transduction histidine kinase
MPAFPESALLFNALPTPHLLLSAAFVIEAVSDSYLHATLTQREHLVGQYMFDAFPDNPETPEANGMHNVRASFRQVLATKQPQRIAQQHYDVPDPERPGHFVERYWQALNAPILDAQGNVSHIIHAAIDVTTEVQAQTRLRESQAAEQAARRDAEAHRQRFQEVLMQLPAYVAVYQGPDHVYDFVNPPYQSLFPHRSFLGRMFREGIPESVELGVVALFDRVYQTGEPFSLSEMEGWFDFKGNGEPEQVFLNLYMHPLHNAQGEVNGILDFSYNVTEQVRSRQQVEQLNQELETRVQQRTQQALALQADLLAAAQQQAQAREMFYQVFAQTPAAICIQRGPEHRYEYANQAYLDFFPGRVFIGQSVAEALPETVASGVVALLDHVYQTGETYYGYELPLLFDQPVGPPRQMYFTFTYQALRENGEIVGISTFAYDVAEQVLARQQSEHHRQELVELFMQAPTPIVILDGPNLVFQLINPAYQLIFPGRELAGKPLLQAMPELVGTPIPDLFQHVYQTGEPVTVQEMPLQMARREGQAPEEIYWTFTYQARHSAPGVIDGVRVFAHDVTEQVRIRLQVENLNQELAAINEELHATNEELNETNTQLTRTNVDLDTFVYTASHDLKAPITNIESIVLALRDTLPADVRQDQLVAHLLDLLNQTVARFQVTIGQLTDISRLQLAHVGLAEPVVLATVVEAVRLDLAPTVVAADTQLTVAVAPDLVVSFSPANLRSIIYNLLSNAIKYRAPDRPSLVQLHARQTPDAITLTVQDNGLGMSQVQQRQLFGLFQRLHTHVEGTGVGLYITKRLIENGGGTIAVESQPQVGTIFTITLPILSTLLLLYAAPI